MLVDTCGSENLDNGADTVVKVYKRVKGLASEVNLDLKDFSIVTTNYDAFIECSLLSKTGSPGDSILAASLSAGVQYLILVVSASGGKVWPAFMSPLWTESESESKRSADETRSSPNVSRALLYLNETNRMRRDFSTLAIINSPSPTCCQLMTSRRPRCRRPLPCRPLLPRPRRRLLRRHFRRDQSRRRPSM